MTTHIDIRHTFANPSSSWLHAGRNGAWSKSRWTVPPGLKWPQIDRFPCAVPARATLQQVAANTFCSKQLYNPTPPSNRSPHKSP